MNILFSLSLHFDSAPADVWDMFYKTRPTDNHANEDLTLLEVDADNKKYYIYNCVFKDQQGGCIYAATKDSVDFLHSFCLFHDNSNTNIGGIVYFTGNSQIVQHRFCAYKTVKPKDGIYSYTEVSNANNFNYLIDCSVSHCSSSDFGGNYAIIAYNGAGLLSSSNSSQSSCQNGPGYVFQDSNPSATINYTTVSNNTAKGYVISHSSSGVYFLKKSNIINNEITEVTNSVIVVSSSKDSLTVDSCCFFGNNPNQGKLFGLYNNYNGEMGQIIVKDSHVDKFSENIKIETNNIIKDTSSVFLAHFASYKCDAVMPFQYYEVAMNNIVCMKNELQCTCEFLHEYINLAAFSLGFFFI